jgi:SAM-dependent methyltransferase
MAIDPLRLRPGSKVALWSLVACMATIGWPVASHAAGLLTPSIPGVVNVNTRIDLVNAGFAGSEGPLGLPDGSLLFAEPRADRITRVAPDGSLSTALENTEGANALAWGSHGELYATRGADATVAVIFPPQQQKVLAERAEGQRLGRLNDLLRDQLGNLYVTAQGTAELPAGVFRVSRKGDVTRLASGLVQPQGLQLSVDERVLYVTDGAGNHVLAYDLTDEGQAGPARHGDLPAWPTYRVTTHQTPSPAPAAWPSTPAAVCTSPAAPASRCSHRQVRRSASSTCRNPLKASPSPARASARCSHWAAGWSTRWCCWRRRRGMREGRSDRRPHPPPHRAIIVMTTPLDVPSPIDLQSRQDAVAWEQNAMNVRPWRIDFFERFASEIGKVPDPVRVLELGSGPGFLAAHLLKARPDLSMVLLDFSAPMHDLARARLASDLGRVEFIERSFKDPHWFDALTEFDFVVTNQAVHELRHKRYASTLHRQVRHVLGPKGRYLVSDHYAGDGGMKNTDLYMSLQEHHEALVAAGYSSISELLRKGGMVLHSAAAV